MSQLFRSRLIVYSLILSFLSIPLTHAAFADVPSTSPYYTAISYVQANKIINGYPDGTFQPEKSLNRAELIKIAILTKYSETAGDQCLASTSAIFRDVPKTAWFAKYICLAKKNGIAIGYTDGNFQPSQTVNFVEATKIIVLTLSYSVKPDSSIWYKPYVEILAEKNAIPMSITNLNQLLKRGEIAEIIYRLKSNTITKDSQTYADLAGSTQTAATPKTNNPSQQDSHANPETLPEPARYVDYSATTLQEAKQKGYIVLFFYAPWCPTCQAADQEIRQNTGTLPMNLTLLRIDYDSNQPLRQKYGITYQHTFVQIDPQENLIEKWNGGGISLINEKLKL